MNKIKIAKFATKAVVGFTVSAVIGYLIKGERHVSGLIDARWADKTPPTDV